MLRSVLVVSLALVLLMGCGSKEKKKESEIVDTVDETTGTAANSKDQDVKFPVYDYEGLEPLLNKEDDKTYIINFWATWCKPCIEELPYFEQVNAEMKDENVEVVLVSLDMPTMWKSRLEPYVEKNGLKSKVVILDDPKQNDWIPKVAEEWGGGIPATLIYNKEKRGFYERGFTYEELNEELNKFIN
ncbi:TlpA family protein disulfide reductase [Flagellimonas sp. HMM57]|uniref:TlpA family protein disulfide reductase n=1 Tax=unclassified Flagellimonas TaxID=2644544 RepID=UPI0013D60B64|nr:MULTISPECIES: TlpA disulfide reductase family protein [unclassified Flagellimonas]UII76618.1 TlpA family protein disulfide reductase [Flagellimonas sp. HMM57]